MTQMQEELNFFPVTSPSKINLNYSPCLECIVAGRDEAEGPDQESSNRDVSER